jgi:hypothetical protein
MTVLDKKAAIDRALAQHTNTPNFCQGTVVDWYEAPHVGDVDGDGDADAIDGWDSEPKKYRHPGDRNPPPGVPLAFGKRFGHRCITLLNPGRLRSTDMSGNAYSPGTTGTVTGTTTSDAIAVIERVMDHNYLGWTETISGQLIPGFPQKPGKPPVQQTRGSRVDLSIRKLRRAHVVSKNPARAKLLAAAIAILRKIPTHDVKN